MSTRPVFLLPIGILVVFAVGLGYMLLQDRNPSNIPSALIDQPAPDFDLPAIEGLEGVEGFATKDLIGEATLVNVFASWCIPCLAEHPIITELSADGYRVFGINYRDKGADAKAWLARNGNPYARVGADIDARAGLEWGVTGVPETFVVDAAGIVRFKHTGPLTRRIVAEEILPALRRAATP